MAKLRITQVRSLIRQSEPQRRAVKSLGLRRIRHAVELEDSPMVRGTINKIRHLISVEEVKE